MPAVVIAATNLMPALQERLADEGELLAFADTEPIQALQAILEQRPSLIVLERLFAATPRGAALINRIKTDPQLVERRGPRHVAHRRLLASGRQTKQSRSSADAGPVASGPATSVVVAPAEPATRPLDWHGTRRAARYRVRPGVEIQVDGNPASVVDLSIVGVQVLSSTILRPNQKVRISIPNEEFVMRFRGAIAWAKFELPKPNDPPRYRAGVDFADADAVALDEFVLKIKV